MKTFILLLIVIGLVVLGAGFYIWSTASQAKELYSSPERDAIEGLIREVKSGECSKMPELRSKVGDATEKVLEICNRVGVSWTATKVAGRDVCNEAKDPNNELKQELDRLEKDCNELE
jgi:hypothetical protein